MYQIDDSSAAVALPTPAAAGTAGYFTEGNPGAGTPATRVTGDFLNMLMMELVNTVTAGGLTPSKTTYTQLRDAVKNLATGLFTQSFGSSGYVKFPNGWIVNWGQATLSGGTASATFSLAFTSSVYGVIPGTPTQNQTTTSTTVTTTTCGFASSQTTGSFYWFAWGK